MLYSQRETYRILARRIEALFGSSILNQSEIRDEAGGLGRI